MILKLNPTVRETAVYGYLSRWHSLGLEESAVIQEQQNTEIEIYSRITTAQSKGQTVRHNRTRSRQSNQSITRHQTHYHDSHSCIPKRDCGVTTNQPTPDYGSRFRLSGSSKSGFNSLPLMDSVQH
ncbi:hypothetical protein T10_12895 [Trichinella papuae]|uniref:Uncharacterized protein n=1 Tax=Trichinella papuae TaxID=268474 RepID=A0A0V1MGQ8_9BILA|nr:hypothetical protein T10_12895 [Trichinella papuae]